jgi:hypothetical protein
MHINPSPANAGRLAELSAVISENTKIIQEYFAENNLPQLSFDVNAPLDFPVPLGNEKIQNARRAVLVASKELSDLMVGPRDLLRWGSWVVSGFRSI